MISNGKTCNQTLKYRTCILKLKVEVIEEKDGYIYIYIYQTVHKG